MSIQIISPRQRIHRTEYVLDFRFRNDDTGGGYWFDCDKDGGIISTNPDSIANYLRCVDGTYDVIPQGIREVSWSYTEPAVGKCKCGRKVLLEDHYCGATSCDCGRWYNMSGSELNPPHLWEEPIDYDY